MFVTGDELDTLNLIRFKLNVSKEALQNVPQYLEADKIATYVNTLVETVSNHLFMERDYWKVLRNKYRICNCVQVDFSTGEFFSNGACN